MNPGPAQRGTVPTIEPTPEPGIVTDTDRVTPDARITLVDEGVGLAPAKPRTGINPVGQLARAASAPASSASAA